MMNVALIATLFLVIGVLAQEAIGTEDATDTTPSGEENEEASGADFVQASFPLVLSFGFMLLTI